MSELSLLQVVIQGGSFALLAYLAVYGVPKALREFREEREKTVEIFRQELEAERLRNDANLTMLFNKFDRLAESAVCKFYPSTYSSRRPPEVLE